MQKFLLIDSVPSLILKNLEKQADKNLLNRWTVDDENIPLSIDEDCEDDHDKGYDNCNTLNISKID